MACRQEAGQHDGRLSPQFLRDTQSSVLSHLRTPETAPYTDRRYAPPRASDDPRPAFAHDRDRIIHADAFRRLQHKTQVMVVSEGDFFRTRLTHTLETAQIGRAIATLLDLSEPLTEAICLGHDLGHTPFGHTGETALNALLADQGGWDSNFHSLVVVEEIEVNYADYPRPRPDVGVPRGDRPPSDALRSARHRRASMCVPPSPRSKRKSATSRM